jgi:hypothetical protein
MSRFRNVLEELEATPFTIELWSADDRMIEQTLARCAKLTHAYVLFDRIVAEYPNRILRIRQKSRVIREELPKTVRP